MKDIEEDSVGKTVKVRALIQNVQMQGAKMAFVELRKERSWTIQDVMIASLTGTPVSSQMVKWEGGLHIESFVFAKVTIQQVRVPIKSCQVTDHEIHLIKVHYEAHRLEKLGLSLAIASKAVLKIEEDFGEGLQNLNINDTLVYRQLSSVYEQSGHA